MLEKNTKNETLVSTEKGKKYFAELFNTLKDYLTKLSNCTAFLSDLSSSEEESIEFVFSFLTLLKRLSKLSESSTGVSELVEKFRSAIPKDSKSEVAKKILTSLDSLSESEEFEIENEDLEDEVNYVYIWVLNSYKLDLKTTSLEDVKKRFGEFSEEISPTLELEEDLKPKQTSKESKTKKTSHFREKVSSSREKEWTGFSVYRNLFKTERWSFGNSKLDRDEDSFEYIVSRTQALERLEREVRKGRVYIYSTKPVKNLKWKQTLSLLCSIGAVVSCAAFLKSIASGGVTNSQTPSESSLFAIMSFIFFFLTRKENNRFKENENFKYCFSRKIFYYYFFLASFFIFSGTGVNKFFTGNSSDPFQIALFAPLLVLVISSIMIFLIGFFFLNPKKNKALIENLLNKYSHPPYLNN